MFTNHVKRRLEEGEVSVGSWMALPSPEAAVFMSGLPLDWILVDLEHGAIDITTAALMFNSIASGGVAPFVRVPSNTHENIKRVLDAGAWGVLVPMVKTREDAERAVDAMRYPPLGSRSVGGLRHALNFRASTQADYYENANKEIMLIVQIEHIDAVENVEEILSVPGIDAYFVGPNDLAASAGWGLGVSLESDMPELVDAIDRITSVGRKLGLPGGMVTSNAAGVTQRIAEGIQLLSMGSDLAYMLNGVRGDLGRVDWSPSPRATVQSITSADAPAMLDY